MMLPSAFLTASATVLSLATASVIGVWTAVIVLCTLGLLLMIRWLTVDPMVVRTRRRRSGLD